MNHLTIASLFFSSITYTAQGQSITNVQARQDNNTIVITYDLQVVSTSNISLFYSDDGGASFIGPLKSVSGDIGENITPGSKAVTWNTLQDQEMLIGDKIIFRIVTSKFGFLTDSRDGKKYKTIQIESYRIMSENLAFKPHGGDYWAYGNDTVNVAKYGYLYNWETAKKVCPEGWHLPSKAEWTALASYLGGEKIAGGKLKETGTNHWVKPNTGATNETGFTALPGGFRWFYDQFQEIGIRGYWWSSDEIDAVSAWGLQMYFLGNNVACRSWTKDYGFSIRCLRN